MSTVIPEAPETTLPIAFQSDEIEEKPLKLVIVGHVDHGKSTLIGRILYDTRSLAEGRVEKIRRICEAQHKPFELAFLLDALEEEQLQGITIDTTQIAFRTDRRRFIIIDAPGHKEFLKNMISGAADADAAVLIIDAQEGIREQSRRHGYLLSLLGITNVVVVVNKMDLVQYRREAFDAIQTEYLAFLRELGITPRQVIPVSARQGDNVVFPSENLSWYSGGPLLDALETLSTKAQRQSDGLRFVVQDVYKFDTRRIVAGRIESGSLQVGDQVEILPTGHQTKIRSIECWPEPEDPLTRAEAGFTVGITLDEQLFIDRGHVIVHPGHGPKPTRLMTTNIFWMGHAPLVYGKYYKIKVGTQETGGFVQGINRVMNSSSIEVTSQASEVQRHEVGEVIFRTEQPLVVDPFDQFCQTGRLVVMDGYDVAGGGIVLQVNPLESPSVEGKNDIPVSREDRERMNGHQAGLVLVDIRVEDCQELQDAVCRLERLLFESGFKTYALSEADNLSLVLPALLDAGLLLILPKPQNTGNFVLPEAACPVYTVRQTSFAQEIEAIRQVFIQ